MDRLLESKLGDLAARGLRAWTDSRYIARGQSYLSRVGEPKWTAGGELVAKVRGTSVYTTRLFLDENGELDADCSCPVGGRCKHAVALALYAAQLLRTGMQFAETDDSAAVVGENRAALPATDRDGILFWFIAVPGVKAVSGLRDLTRIPCRTAQEGNGWISELCEGMYDSGLLARDRHEEYGVAKNTYRLAKRLSVSGSLRRRLAALKAAGAVHKDGVEVAPAAVPMLAKEFGDGTGEGLPRALKENGCWSFTTRSGASPRTCLKAQVQPVSRQRRSCGCLFDKPKTKM